VWSSWLHRRVKPEVDTIPTTEIDRLAIVTNSNHQSSKMSGWAAYTTALVNTKNVSYAAIIGLDGATWANSDAKNFPITAAEAKTLVAAFKDASPLRANGLIAGGVKHIALGCDDSVLQGKKGTGGIVVGKTNKTIVIGVYTAESGIQAGPASDAVQKLQADLKKKTF
jgi:hypothetical protein